MGTDRHASATAIAHFAKRIICLQYIACSPYPFIIGKFHFMATAVWGLMLVDIGDRRDFAASLAERQSNQAKSSMEMVDSPKGSTGVSAKDSFFALAASRKATKSATTVHRALSLRENIRSNLVGWIGSTITLGAVVRKW